MMQSVALFLCDSKFPSSAWRGRKLANNRIITVIIELTKENFQIVLIVIIIISSCSSSILFIYLFIYLLQNVTRCRFSAAVEFAVMSALTLPSSRCFLFLSNQFLTCYYWLRGR